jgi:hypothetical protein
MNAGSVFAILILTTEVAYTCRGAKSQAHMTIMTLVHSMHHMEWTRRVNRRQLEEHIPIKGGRKELHPLDVKSVKIKCLEKVPNSLSSQNPLQGIYNTKTLLMTDVGRRMI